MFLRYGDADRKKAFSNRDIFTFLGEKVLGIFARHYEFTWDTPQQLNDQCYMVYVVDECKKNKQDKHICQTKSQSEAHSGCVGGGLRGETDSAHT